LENVESFCTDNNQDVHLKQGEIRNSELDELCFKGGIFEIKTEKTLFK